MKRLASVLLDLVAFGLLVTAAWMTNHALGVLVAGIVLLVVNFWLMRPPSSPGDDE